MDWKKTLLNIIKGLILASAIWLAVEILFALYHLQNYCRIAYCDYSPWIIAWIVEAILLIVLSVILVIGSFKEGD